MLTASVDCRPGVTKKELCLHWVANRPETHNTRVLVANMVSPEGNVEIGQSCSKLDHPYARSENRLC